MALAKKKQDEKNLQLLKSLVALPFNKQCFDCSQKGPTYVDLTIGSFICMSCSGILRGLNPPHRVKSITMSTFTDDEIEFIRSRGNFFCREVWLGNYNTDRAPSIDLHNDQNKKDYLSVKYERRQWYVEPSPGLFQEAKQLTDSALTEHEQMNQPQTRPGRSFSGSNPIAPLHHHQNGGSNSAKIGIGNLPMPMPPPVVEQPQTTSPIQTPPAPPQQQIISFFDDDLETALRRQSIPNIQQQQVAPPPVEPPKQHIFPVSFGTMEPTPFTKAAQLAAGQNSSPPPQPQPNIPASPPVPAANFGGFADFDSAFGKDSQKSSAPPAPIIMAPPPDRYKALEELDDLLTLTGSTVVVSSGIDWGGQKQPQPSSAPKTQQQPQLPSFAHPPNYQASFNSSDPFNTSNVFAAAGIAPPAMAPPPYSAFGQPQQPFPPVFNVPNQQQNAFPSMMPQAQPFGVAQGFATAFPPQPTPFGVAPQPNPQLVANPFRTAGMVPQQQQQFPPSAQPFQFPVQAQPPSQQRPSFSNNPFLFN